jgi:hypothetical protein
MFMQFVYFAQQIAPKGRGMIKIGKSKTPADRQLVIQGLNPEKIKILGIADGGERETHRMFEQYKVQPDLPRHEWFFPHPRLLRFIRLFSSPLRLS